MSGWDVVGELAEFVRAENVRTPSGRGADTAAGIVASDRNDHIPTVICSRI